ncbi:unnamed protein product [Cuscuta campestris]|uniref:PHD-type zinc finger plants domain-containing protein n=1 Tax=Cuscuta campestris TaxID=132261 RepID=A0A484L150_9ASTE|nr:unnamed protein product [Cuscuta campestris]
MVDLQTVCCMCGDVGFPDKLFRCSTCRRRFQHGYCSSYYSEYTEPIQVCDWCQCEQRTSGGSSRKMAAAGTNPGTKRSEFSGNKIKNHDNDKDYERPSASKNPTGGAPSPRTAGTRRYKLLKDVMC